MREGFFLWTHDKSPYAGSAYHQPPLLLSLFSLGASLSHAQLCLLFVFLDLVNLLLVSSINRQLYGSSASPLPALIYALNPFCVVSALGLATTTLANLLLLAAFSLHLSKSPIVSVFFAPIALGIAAYFNYALLILAIPLSLLTKAPAISRLSSHGLTLLTVVGLYFASFLLMDASWAWAWDTVGYEILLQELTPNMGPLWYLFTELFAEFTPLFQFAVQGYILILVAPLTYKFSHRPLLLLWLLLSVVVFHRSFVGLSDVALHLTVLSFLHTELAGFSYKLFLFAAMAFLAVLTPVFHHMWLYAGSGNANFYFALCMVFGAVEISLVGGILSTAQVQEYQVKIASEASATSRADAK